MTVTDIKEYKNGKYEIYLNDEFAFVLYKSEIRKLNIEKGKEISDEGRSDILNGILSKRAIKRAMNLLIKTDRTEADLRRKLRENRYPETVIDTAVEYVKGFHYIDDERYAKAYISAKAGSCSLRSIRQKLVEKGIDKDIIDNELEDYYSLEGAALESELIRVSMLKICPNPASLDHNERQKLFAKLYRRGFSISDIEKVYSSL